jgi:hypothetical protein
MAAVPSILNGYVPPLAPALRLAPRSRVTSPPVFLGIPLVFAVDNAAQFQPNAAHRIRSRRPIRLLARKGPSRFFPVTPGFIAQIAAMHVNESLAAIPRRPWAILGKIRSDIRQIPIPW